MYTTSRMDKYNDLQRAVGFDANKICPILFQHLGYRKHVAEELLKGGEHDKMEALEELYEQVNNEIKLILGIENELQSKSTINGSLPTTETQLKNMMFTAYLMGQTDVKNKQEGLEGRSFARWKQKI